MSTGAHRKTQAAEPIRFGIPWGHALLVVALILALAAGLLLAASLNNPAHASTGYLKAAVTAGKDVRPYWDGRSPAVYVGDAEPMCKPRYAGRLGMAEDAPTGVWFALACKAEGDSGPWSWTVLGTRNGQSLAWSQVRAWCRQVGCKRPSRAILASLGYRPGTRAWMHVGSTTVVFVKTARGVKVYDS